MAKEQAAAKPAEDDKEPAAAEGGEGEAVAEGDSAPVKLPLWKRKKKLILIGAAALIAVLGGGVGLYVSGIFQPAQNGRCRVRSASRPARGQGS